MRKEFIAIAAVIAVGLAGYLTWQRAKEGPTVNAEAPPAASQNAPAQTPPPAAQQ